MQANETGHSLNIYTLKFMILLLLNYLQNVFYVVKCNTYVCYECYIVDEDVLEIV